MTKAKLAFVHCRLGCLSCRPVCFFPRLFPFACLLLFACRRFRCPALGPAGFSPRRIFRHRLIVFSFPPSGSFLSVFFLLPVRCCSPVVVFAVRHWDLPAFPRGGFFAIVLLSFSSRCPVRFFPSFPFCLSVVVRLSSFSLSGNWDLPAFPRGGFFAIVLLSFSSRCPVRFFPSFPFCLSVVVRLSSFSLSGNWDLPAFPRGGFFASGLLSFPSRRPVRFFPSFSFCRYFPSLFAFSFVAFCI